MFFGGEGFLGEKENPTNLFLFCGFLRSAGFPCYPQPMLTGYWEKILSVEAEGTGLGFIDKIMPPVPQFQKPHTPRNLLGFG